MDAPFTQAWSVLKAEPYINLERNIAPNMPFIEDAIHSQNNSFIPSLSRYQQSRPDGPNYRRGGSVPRTLDSGAFVGVNVAGIMGALRNLNPNMSDEELQDKFTERLARTSAHEHIHDLTEDEIVNWASRAVGGSPSGEGMVSVPHGAEDDYRTLAQIGREYGAYTATEPENMKQRMLRYPFAPYLTGEKDLADLHINPPPK
ncbi:MAG: hypothetical protein CL524_12960 [Aequorivita sp.]|mgnify:CR=1 FL=1|nr:hypothetical protein [Aequorivita sp.]